MNIVYKKVSELIPYEKNPRINDDAVQGVANSIKEFGFKVPIVIDKNGVVVTGHTRLKACKQLNITEVPCIIADDLSDEQIKAFRLADNKVSEKSEWDFKLLDEELSDIFNIDMEQFDFSFNDENFSINQGKDEIADTKSNNVIYLFGKKIYTTDEEKEKILKIFDEYCKENKVTFGFISYLLGDK